MANSHPDISETDGTSLSRLVDMARTSFRRTTQKIRLSVILFSTGIFVSGFLLLTIAEHLFYLGAAVKISLLIFFLLCSVAGGLVLGRKQESNTFESFYRSLSASADLPALRYAFDLGLFSREKKLKLYKVALEKNTADITESDFKTRLDRYANSRPEHELMKRASLFAALSLAGILLFSAIQPDSLQRTLHAWESYSPPNPYSYSIRPGNITLEQGSSFEPKIMFSDEMPSEVTLAFKTRLEEEYRKRPADVINREEASVSFGDINLNASGSYYIEMDGFRSPVFDANIQLLPRFESLSVKVIPPTYTGLDSTLYSYPVSRIPAYRGSSLEVSGLSNKMLQDLEVSHYVSGKDHQMEPVGNNRFSYTFEVSASDTLSFSMRDTAGLTNKNNFEIVVEAINDEPPFVLINKPEGNLEMHQPEDLTLEYEASDDFGLQRGRLHYEINRAFTDRPEKGAIGLELPPIGESGSYLWKVEELDPKPRDVISYWIEVADNDGYSGSKTSRSQTLTLTFPSLTSYLDELENKENDVQQSLEDVSESYEQMKQEYDRFKEQLKQNPEGSWQQLQSLEELKQQQEEIDKQVEELNKKFEEIRSELQKSGTVSEETMKAYDELKQLMEEIDDPELKKALEELQKSLGNFDRQQLREALENYEFNEQQYQERLNRTLELFKTLKMNSDLEKMAKALEELAKQEEALSGGEMERSEQIEQQKAIKQDTGNLARELDSLAQNPPKRYREQLEQLRTQSEEQLKSVRDSLQNNIRKMQENQKGDGKQSPQNNEIRRQQQQIQQSLEQMAKQMRSARQQFSSRQKQINLAALQYILYSLIDLSHKQEELSRETEQLSSRSQAFVEKARTQQTIKEHFSRLADSLYAVSTEIPTLSNRINEKKSQVQRQLAISVEQLAERDKSRSTYAERQSLGGINELSSMIASLINQIQNQEGGGGGAGNMTVQQFMEQLRQMSGQQQMLNEQMQNLINDIQGDRLSRDQLDRLNQMARQQNQIRKQLQELQRKGGLEAGDKILSELERMSEEMEETINDLRGGQTDRTLIKRQQNILSRMLNAEKAMQERGEEERREATTAEDSPQAVPPDLTLEELQKKIRSLLNDPNRTKFSEDYQKLIRQYFELLKKLEKENS